MAVTRGVVRVPALRGFGPDWLGGRCAPRAAQGWRIAMATLELRLLGDLEVVRDGEAMPLPPSRKTRALLAYLALKPRAVRREHLCELFWDVPDDPRGSLRWSLSKLRRLVDETGRRRVIADRLGVRLDTVDMSVDVLRLHQVAAGALESQPLALLETATSLYRGNFLEGLELPNVHGFHAWCLAERERASQSQARVLRALVDRLAGSEAREDAERALPHAMSLVGVCPYDESARVALVGLLSRLGRGEQATQQYHLATRTLAEIGISPTHALYRAWRSRPATGPVSRSTTGVLSTPSPLPVSGLLGRDAELQCLSAAWEAAVERREARVVMVCGEAGVGKSSLLATMLERGRGTGALVLEASAIESEVIRPFALWTDALRRLSGTADPDPFGVDVHDNRDRLFGALSEMVAERSRERPVVVCFDDLHWCDESSAAALHYVTRMNRQSPLIGLLAGREGVLRDNTAVQRLLRGLRHDGLLTELRLSPLPESAMAALILRQTPGTDPQRLARSCGGNPLLGIELARAEAAGESGGSLDDLIRERLARLGADALAIVQWAALLSPRLDVASLARATGKPAEAIGEAMAEAERQSILVPGEQGLRFAHDLVVRAVYRTIAPARRRLMHRRAAELLVHDTALDLRMAADLAHHAAQSGDPLLTAKSMVSAARLCLRFFANEQALSLARKGQQLLARLHEPDRVCLDLELRDVMLSAGPLSDWRGAADEYVALAEQAMEYGALGHARLGYYLASLVRWQHGQWAGAREETLQAERVTRTADDGEQIAGMAEAARCLAMLERDLPRAQSLAEQARVLAARRGVRHPALAAALGLLCYHENRLDEAEELLLEARTLWRLTGDRINEFQAMEYLVMVDFERGRYDSARARCATLLALGEKLREGSEAPFAGALRALCTYALEDDGGPLVETLPSLRAVDAKFRLAYVLTRAALLDVERGRPAAALERAGEALGHAGLLERPTEVLLARVVLACACHALGDAPGREAHAAAIADLADAPVARWARQRLPMPWLSAG